MVAHIALVSTCALKEEAPEINDLLGWAMFDFRVISFAYLLDFY